MPVVILMPSIFLGSCFLFLESLEFNSRFWGHVAFLIHQTIAQVVFQRKLSMDWWADTESCFLTTLVGGSLRARSNRFETRCARTSKTPIDLLITATSLPHSCFWSFYCFVGLFLWSLFYIRTSSHSKSTINQLSIITMSNRYCTSAISFSCLL